jgi:hypothetical protein
VTYLPSVPLPLIDVPDPPAEPAPTYEPLRRRRAPRTRLRTFMIGLSGGTVLLLVLAVLAVATIFSPIGARRAGRLAADQELRGELAPDERLIARGYVSQRNWIDNFRESFGVLVATDRRLLFVGAPPASLLRASEGPPELRVESVPYDATFTVDTARMFFGTTPAVVVRTPAGNLWFIVPRDEQEGARAVDETVDRVLLARAREREREMAATAAPQRAPDVYVTHVVRYGEALTTIARRYRTTPDVVRQLNNLSTDAIRAGQRLRVPAPPDTTGVAPE